MGSAGLGAYIFNMHDTHFKWSSKGFDLINLSSDDSSLLSIISVVVKIQLLLLKDFIIFATM